MSNPLGYVPALGPPEGLAPCGQQQGLLDNYIGGGADPGQSFVNGTVFYLRGIPPELTVDGGPACSPGPLDAIGQSGTHYPYAGPFPVNAAVGGGLTSSIAADAASGAGCQYVTVEVSGQISIAAGHISCTTTVDPAAFNTFTLAMAGLGGYRMDFDFPAAPGVAAPFVGFPGDPANSYGADLTFVTHLLRPTAHTWPGQDPDNDFNRALWLPSEIGPITWGFGGIGAAYTTSVAYLVLGYKPETYPSPCPPPPPSTVVPGTPVGGLLHGNHNLGGDGAPTTVGGPGGATGTYTITDLVYLARATGLTGTAAAIAAAIAMAESSGNPNATNFNPGPPPSTDRGLWQINNVFHPEISDTCAFNPACCAGAMYTISSGGTNWTPWSTYNNGAYLAFLPQALAVP